MKINDRGKWEFMGGKNPTFIPLTFSQTLSPHADVSRGTVVIKKGRAAILKTIHLGMLRIGAAAVTARHEAYVILTKQNGHIIRAYEIVSQNAIIGVGEVMDVECQIPLLGGDTVEIRTADTSVGGGITYTLNTTLIEFDF